MKKEKYIFLIAALLLGSTAGGTAQEIPEPAPQPPAYVEKLAAAKKSQEKGEFEKAQKQYEALLNGQVLDNEARKQARKGYEEVNFHLLMSKKEGPDSTVHKVVRGDSLYVIARKYGTTVDLIRRANSLSGDTIFPDMELKILNGEFRIKIDKSDNVLELYYNEKPIKSYSVATGENNSTPVGDFEIVNKLENPTWFKAGAIIPPDSSDNELGTRWMGFDSKGYGIHGTIHPEAIGAQVSAGCIRMLNSHVEELYALVPIGTKGFITD